MTDEPARPLTQRQQEVAELLAAGLTRKQIAATLAISPRTVKRHIENLSLILDGPAPLRIRVVRYVLLRDAA